ncbi:PAS domain-containing protein [Haladaptatus sp. NG-WS-4]
MATDSLTPTQRKTLAAFDGSGTPRTTMEVAEHLNLGRRSTYGRLERLVNHGQLNTKKVGASARVWWRPVSSSSATHTKDSVDRLVAESITDDVLNRIEVGVFILDENFDIVWINDATERYFELDRERVIGRDKRQLLDERIATVVDNSVMFAETIRDTYDGNTYLEHSEWQITADDGCNERWLDYCSKPIESGAYAGGRVELYYDITDRKTSDQALASDQVLFESMNSASKDATSTADTTERLW